MYFSRSHFILPSVPVLVLLLFLSPLASSSSSSSWNTYLPRHAPPHPILSQLRLFDFWTVDNQRTRVAVVSSTFDADLYLHVNRTHRAATSAPPVGPPLWWRFDRSKGIYGVAGGPGGLACLDPDAGGCPETRLEDRKLTFMCPTPMTSGLQTAAAAGPCHSLCNITRWVVNRTRFSGSDFAALPPQFTELYHLASEDHAQAVNASRNASHLPYRNRTEIEIERRRLCDQVWCPCTRPYVFTHLVAQS